VSDLTPSDRSRGNAIVWAEDQREGALKVAR